MLSNSPPEKFDIGERLRRVRDTLALALAAALPLRCALCAAPSASARLCAACEAALPTTGAACPGCALPVPLGTLCGACLRRAPPQARTVAALAYAFPVDRLVGRLKYGGDLSLAPALAAPLARALRAQPVGSPPAQAIVPMPLATRRQRERGFNQSCEIARALSGDTGLPVFHALARVRDAPAQASLPRARRAANVRGAFVASAAVRGLRVALIDDVMTTGATAGSAARALLAAGASRVDAWVVARTLPGREG